MKRQNIITSNIVLPAMTSSLYMVCIVSRGINLEISCSKNEHWMVSHVCGFEKHLHVLHVLALCHQMSAHMLPF